MFEEIFILDLVTFHPAFAQEWRRLETADLGRKSPWFNDECYQNATIS
jgi:hypothetical protein